MNLQANQCLTCCGGGRRQNNTIRLTICKNLLSKLQVNSKRNRQIPGLHLENLEFWAYPLDVILHGMDSTRSTRELKTFLWDSVSCWHDCSRQFLQIYQLHIHAVNLPFYHIPTVFYWIQIRGLGTPTPKKIKLIVMFMKPVWDDFCFVTWCIIMLEVSIRRWVHCGHEGMRQYSNRLWRLSGINGPKVCQEDIPHTITPPPPAWTVDTRQGGSMDSSCGCQILTLPSVCFRRNWHSSEHATFFQSSTVKFWWACAHCSLSFLFLADRSGTRRCLLLL